MSKMNFSWKTLGMIVIPIAIIMLIFENNQNLEMKTETNVYKILTQEQWLISKILIFQNSFCCINKNILKI